MNTDFTRLAQPCKVISSTSVIYVIELEGSRVVFTRGIGVDNQDILHRCSGDVGKAKSSRK